MTKQEVELMIIQVKLGTDEIINMKVYKDGTLCRNGCGGLPAIPVSGMTLEGDKRYWNELFAQIDDQIVENPVNHEEQNIQQPLEYALAFFGASSNGQTGERANWTKASGIRFLLDSESSFRHPLLGFIDGFAIKAAEVTNEWFFDIMMSAVYGLKPHNLENTFVTAPKTDQERQEALSNYANQIEANRPRGWDIVKIGNDRKYTTPDGRELISSVENNNGALSINFMERFDSSNLDEAAKRFSQIAEDNLGSGDASATSKKWWEFWK